MGNRILRASGPDSAGSVTAGTISRSLEARRHLVAEEVQRLVEAAFECIRRTGRLEPRVSEVVAEAGLSNKAFYRHFRSKDELLLAVLDSGVRLLADYLADRMDRATTPEGKVEAWLTGMSRQAVRAEAAAATRPFVLSRGRLSDLFAAEIAESDSLLTALVRDALEAARSDGTLPEVDPARDAEMLFVLAMGWLQRRLVDPEPVPEQDAMHMVEFAMRGLSRHGTSNE